MVEQVYQPTTTRIGGVNNNKAWIPSFTSGSLWSRTLILIMSIMFAIMGLVMIIVGTTSLQSYEDGSIKEINTTAYIIILCMGVLLELAAIFAIVIYMRSMGYYIPCCPGKIALIRKRLHQNQLVMSSDGVHCAQYCPPGELPAQQQRLMEDKTDLGDDTERILEEDPRIVLTPLKQHDDC